MLWEPIWDNPIINVWESCFLLDTLYLGDNEGGGVVCRSKRWASSCGHGSLYQGQRKGELSRRLLAHWVLDTSRSEVFGCG